MTEQRQPARFHRILSDSELAGLVHAELECPDCGEPMMLKSSRYGLFYGCSTYPKCRSNHGAHPDGSPMGIPANAETKAWRHKAHEAFDKLWDSPDSTMSRKEAYRWMIETMALSRDDAHIAMFGINQCKQLIAAIEFRDQLEAINQTKRK